MTGSKTLAMGSSLSLSANNRMKPPAMKEMLVALIVGFNLLPLTVGNFDDEFRWHLGRKNRFHENVLQIFSTFLASNDHSSVHPSANNCNKKKTIEQKKKIELFEAFALTEFIDILLGQIWRGRARQQYVCISRRLCIECESHLISGRLTVSDLTQWEEVAILVFGGRVVFASARQP